MKSARISQLFNLLEQNPDDAFLNFAIAQEMIKNNKLDEALKYFDKLLITNPEYTATYYHLGKLHERLGNSELAENTYKEGMKLTKENGEAHAYSELETALEMLTED